MRINRREVLKKSAGAAAGGVLAILAGRVLASSRSTALIPSPQKTPVSSGLMQPPVEIISDTLEDNWHAFYSRKAAQNFGFVVYCTPDGHLVPVTAVYRCLSDGQRDYCWDDTEYHGIVEHYVTGWRFDNLWDRRRTIEPKPRLVKRYKKDRLADWCLNEFDFKSDDWVKFQPKWSYPLPDFLLDWERLVTNWKKCEGFGDEFDEFKEIRHHFKVIEQNTVFIEKVDRMAITGNRSQMVRTA